VQVLSACALIQARILKLIYKEYKMNEIFPLHDSHRDKIFPSQTTPQTTSFSELLGNLKLNLTQPECTDRLN
jgi:hypothetical protein